MGDGRMRFVPVVAGEIATGDVLKSITGRTMRSVIYVDGESVVLRRPTGTIETMKMSQLERYWVRVIEEA